MTAQATILVVDDDRSMRLAVTDLLHSAGYQVRAFASAQELLADTMPDVEHCLVLDVNLPGLDGLQLQERLAQLEMPTPIVFITGHADVPKSVRAMKAGAVEFLMKPFRDHELLKAIDTGLERSLALRSDEARLREVRRRYATLSPRQRAVMLRVTNGMLNKQIAIELGMSEVTVKVHRREAMHRMGAETLPDLVRLADQLCLRG